MSWAVGYDENWKRDIGYGVPAICDHPGCNAKIDRGLSYVCGNDIKGGDRGCGLYFCSDHLTGRHHLCERCASNCESFEAKPDVEEWTNHKMTDPSWAEWRKENGIEQRKEAMTDSTSTKRDAYCAAMLDLVGSDQFHDVWEAIAEFVGEQAHRIAELERERDELKQRAADDLMQFAKWFFVAITSGVEGIEEYDPEEIESEDYATIRHWLAEWRKQSEPK